jgi:uncharacterized protein (DUF58 family)
MAAAAVGWQPTRALRRGIALAVLTVLAATALGTPELVLVAVPFAFGTALSLAARPARPPAAALVLDQPSSVEGGELAARVRVENHQPQRLLCVVRAQVPDWVRLRHGTGSYATLLPPATATSVRLQGTVSRWGAYRLGPAVARTVACDGLLVADSEVMPAVPLTVYPVSEHFDSEQALPRAAGIVGIHRSRRLGDGGELADVRPFQAGDRLRRINWRVSRRTGDLHVNATMSDRDAEVLLLLDVRRETGDSGGLGGAVSVLDATVRAAAAITGHYAQQGDRVAMVEFGSGLRRLRSGTGRRHYLSALQWLVQVERNPSGFAPANRLITSRLQPPGALLVVLTPLLDQDSVNLLAVLARSGRSMVTVDTLPERVDPPRTSEWTPAASRLWQLERANTIGRLRSVGVAVEPWRGPGSLDLMLRHVHRLATSSRLVVSR